MVMAVVTVGVAIAADTATTVDTATAAVTAAPGRCLTVEEEIDMGADTPAAMSVAALQAAPTWVTDLQVAATSVAALAAVDSMVVAVGDFTVAAVIANSF
jgi:hypothetical protein